MASSPSRSRTTARLTISPMRRMPTCGWLMMAAPKRFPFSPGLETVNDPPESSSAVTLPVRPRAARSSMARARPSTLSSLALRITGTRSPFSVSTATPRFTSLRRMTLSSCTTAFSRGNSARACTVARQTPTRKLGAFPPVSLARFHSLRSFVRFVMSTSAVQGTCGLVALL